VTAVKRQQQQNNSTNTCHDTLTCNLALISRAYCWPPELPLLLSPALPPPPPLLLPPPLSPAPPVPSSPPPPLPAMRRANSLRARACSTAQGHACTKTRETGSVRDRLRGLRLRGPAARHTQPYQGKRPRLPQLPANGHRTCAHAPPVGASSQRVWPSATPSGICWRRAPQASAMPARALTFSRRCANARGSPLPALWGGACARMQPQKASYSSRQGA
jgi:hypothetical protein